MPPNTFFGKKSVINAIINNEKAFLLSSQRERKLALRYGHVVISLFGYPLSSGSRIQMHRLFKLLKGEDSSLLDVGCSFGIFSFELQRREFEVKGIDINKINIEVANHIKDILGWGPDFAVSDVEELPGFSDSFFSTILVSHVIEHIKNPKEMLMILSNKLKPGGAMIITVNPVQQDTECDEPYDDFVLSEDCNGERGEVEKLLTGAQHYRYGMTTKKLSRLLIESGLRIEKVDYTRHPEFLRDSKVFFPLVYPLHKIFGPFSKKIYSINIKARKPL